MAAGRALELRGAAARTTAGSRSPPSPVEPTWSLDLQAADSSLRSYLDLRSFAGGNFEEARSYFTASLPFTELASSVYVDPTDGGSVLLLSGLLPDSPRRQYAGESPFPSSRTSPGPPKKGTT